MRYSILLASSLAMGALARPHLEQRARRYRIVTETATQTVTVLVTVTLDINLPTGVSSIISIEATPTASSSSISSSVSLPSDIAAPGGASTASSTPVIPSSTGSLSINIAPSSSSVTSVVLPGLESSSSSILSVASSVATPVSSDIVSSSSSSSLVSSVSPSVSPSPSPSSSSAGPPPSNVGPPHASGTGQASLSTGTEYMNAILYHHNAARANHGAGEMTWCTECEANARIAAERCVFEHFLPQGVSEGQNLFTVSGNSFNVTAGITESWYKAELPFMNGHYGEPQIPDDVFHQVGHFTQVVWKGTTSVGCFSKDCGTNMEVNGQVGSELNKFTVCNYLPPGNVNNNYDVNVQPPTSTDAAALGRWDD